MKTVIKIEGLDCAACASELEEEIKKIVGVEEVSVSFVNGRISLSCSDEKVLSEVKDRVNNFEEVKVVEELNRKKHTLHIKGLDCAACAVELEEEIRGLEEIEEVSVSFVNQTIIFSCTEESAVDKVKDIANNFEEVKVVEISKERGRIIKLKNLHCANCAAALQEQILKIEGVNDAVVDYVAQNIVIDASEEAIKKTIKTANRFEKVKVVEDGEVSDDENRKKDIIQICISAVFLVAGILFNGFLFDKGVAFKAFTYIFYGVSYIAVGYPVLISTVKNICKGRIFDENFLMTIASIGAIAMGEYKEGVFVMLLYQIGELLQGIAVGASRKSIVNIMNLKSESATRLYGGKQEVVSPEQLAIGDKILIKAGEKIPVDVRIVKGKTSVDTKSLTGESALRDVEEGEELLSGFINTGNVIEAEVVREYSDSAVSKILDLVENSTAQKAKPEKFITKFAKYYTPIVCALAAAVAVIVPLLLGIINGGGYGAYFRQWINTALVFLVISCPCALIISVPLTYFGGIGTAAKHGILIKGATYLDTLTKVRTIAFDKTGTLTEGEFSIVKINSTDEKETLAVAVALEKCSSHPLAKPFVSYDTGYNAEDAEEIAGRGISAKINGRTALCGNAKLMRENNITFEETASLSTVVYVAYDGKFLGSVEIDDSVKSEAEETVKRLHESGVEKLVMLTGDNEARAAAVGEKLGLDEVKAGLLPDEKLFSARELKEKVYSDGKKCALMYVGDGINDAPVMAVSDCAVSMGKIGSGAAIEASDLVIVSDNLDAIPDAFKIARKTRKIVIQNIVFSIVMKTAFMIMGVVIPSFPLALAVFGDVGVMLIAVLNSMRIRRK